jgi:hypothetical protein
MEDHSQKITFGEMRDMGIRGLLIYCADYRCSHSIAMSGDQWADEVRLSDLEAGLSAASAVIAVRMCGLISIGTEST